MAEETKAEIMELVVTACEKFSSNNEVILFICSNKLGLPLVKNQTGKWLILRKTTKKLMSELRT